MHRIQPLRPARLSQLAYFSTVVNAVVLKGLKERPTATWPHGHANAEAIAGVGG
ncbi:MAG: hypothetical protein JO106_18370 [Mycobacterium sp.]|nr:hypothetical protein [Mycobacterium sp.]